MTKASSIVIILSIITYLGEREERREKEGRDSNPSKVDQEYWQFLSAHSFIHSEQFDQAQWPTLTDLPPLTSRQG